jgi:phosphotransferase system IIB component
MLTEAEREAILDRIVAAAGGVGNIDRVDCCATRLRLAFVDVGLVGVEAFRSIEEVAGLLVRGDEYQLVVGIAASRLRRGLQARVAAEKAAVSEEKPE